MLTFRYTCPRHQQVFIEAAKRGGCYDLQTMDEIRRKTLAWLSNKFPRAVLDHFNEESCLGCKLEANGVDSSDVERVISELAKEALAR
ncbi:MAG: hypothetical protein ACLQJR_18960 [Stellaceae bacterium]